MSKATEITVKVEVKPDITDEITVKVEVKPDITEESAESAESALRCLKIVEWYMNEHNDLQIMVDREPDGYERYTIRKKPWEVVNED